MTMPGPNEEDMPGAAVIEALLAEDDGSRDEPPKRKITGAERMLAVVQARCPAVAADFERSCGKESARILGQLGGADAKAAAAWMLTEALDHINRKRRSGAYRTGGRGAGDCYDAALETFMGFVDDDPQLAARLCHGRIVDRKGNSCPHAWIEVGGLCVDPSNHRDRTLVVGRAKFYKVCGVDEATVIRYTREEVIAHNRRTTHFGPWEGPDAVPPVI